MSLKSPHPEIESEDADFYSELGVLGVLSLAITLLAEAVFAS